ncbi:MAG: hypothetical protein ACXADH_08080 [Candidatus Kariarchaeaceae archaeon]|jgi:hypothetical protein
MNSIRNYKKGQLFLIEVIVALTVLMVLITVLFSTQTISPPPTETNLNESGSNAISALVDSGELWDYYDLANESYHVLGKSRLEVSNVTKISVTNTIHSSIPVIANFKAYLYRYNSTLLAWVQIDVINFETNDPTSSDIVVVEHYSPGYNGAFAGFKFQLNLWFDVVL